MVSPSTEPTQTAWPRQRGSSDQSTTRIQNEAAQQPATLQKIAEDSTTHPPEEQGLHPLPDETFDLHNTSDDGTYLDFTLELSSNSSADNAQARDTDNFTHPEEARYGRKRPELPFTFGFGVRRPMALAVMMRHPILGQDAPATANQAIQDTFDLAATNRLPYGKGSQFYLAA